MTLSLWRELALSRLKLFLSWAFVVLLCFLLGYLLWGRTGGDENRLFNSEHDELRIVSTAPSVTEILCALGLTERIVGVSNYCHYPPEIEGLPRIGSLYDYDTERIIVRLLCYSREKSERI